MAITPKSKTVQFRVDAELFDKFSREVEYCESASVSSVLRSAMTLFIRQMEQRRKTDVSNAEWAATLESRRQASLAARTVEKPPVEAVNKPVEVVSKPMSLSEKRKAEKAAKEARKARKEDRY